MCKRDVVELDRCTLSRVIGGADAGGIMQAAGPLLGMIPGIGSIAQSVLPMIGQLTSKGQQGGGDPQAAAQQAPAQGPSQGGGAVMAQGSAGAAVMQAPAMPRHKSVSVSISQG